MRGVFDVRVNVFELDLEKVKCPAVDFAGNVIEGGVHDLRSLVRTQ